MAEMLQAAGLRAAAPSATDAERGNPVPMASWSLHEHRGQKAKSHLLGGFSV